MTLDCVQTLDHAIEEGIRATHHGATRDVVSWLQTHCRGILDENSLTIEAEGLGNLIRAHRKRKPSVDSEASIYNLCLDFGLPSLDLDREVSVPTDMKNLLYCACDWLDIEDATLADIDKHIVLEQAQMSALDVSIGNWQHFRQSVAHVVPGRDDIPIRELRVIARIQCRQ